MRCALENANRALGFLEVVTGTPHHANDSTVYLRDSLQRAFERSLSRTDIETSPTHLASIGNKCDGRADTTVPAPVKTVGDIAYGLRDRQSSTDPGQGISSDHGLKT